MVYNPVREPFKLQNLDDNLVDIIRYASVKAFEVIGKQEWINSNRMAENAQIGHFVTNLRRDMIALIDRIPLEIYSDRDYQNRYHRESLREFLKKFYDADLWHKIGVPKEHGKWGNGNAWDFCCVHNEVFWKLDWRKLMDLCKRATETQTDQLASKVIDDSLAYLQREMYPLKTGIDNMNRINVESDQIMSKLCSIVEGK